MSIIYILAYKTLGDIKGKPDYIHFRTAAPLFFFCSSQKCIMHILGYKTLAVVEGKADVYVHTTAIKKWDLCAGNAILEALHGNMTTLEGKNLDYSSQVEYKNEGGVLATLTNYSHYLQRLQVLRSKEKA